MSVSAFEDGLSRAKAALAAAILDGRLKLAVDVAASEPDRRPDRQAGGDRTRRPQAYPLEFKCAVPDVRTEPEPS